MIVGSPLLRGAYFLIGGLPALFLCLYAPIALWAVTVVLLKDPSNPPHDLLFVLAAPLFGLGATASGLLVLLNVGVESTRGRVIHTVLLVLGISVGLFLSWPAGDWGVLLFFLPAVIGSLLVIHIWSAPQQRAPADGPRAARSDRG